jgi:hypothetical protein
MVFYAAMQHHFLGSNTPYHLEEATELFRVMLERGSMNPDWLKITFS